jgi:hypothetical protein
MSVFSPIKTRSKGDAFQTGSSKELIRHATMGYLFEKWQSLFPLRSVLATEVEEKSLKLYPMFSLLSETDLESIFESYSVEEIDAIRLDISNTIMVMATTDNDLLLSYVAIFDREMTVPVPDQNLPQKDMLVDLFADYVHPPKRSSPLPVVSSLLYSDAGTLFSPSTTGSKNTSVPSALIDRAICSIDRDLIGIHRNAESIKPFYLYRTPTGAEYVKFRSWALSQLKSLSFYFYAYGSLRNYFCNW